jgi:3-oxoadipate enol-lactonase
MAEFTTGDGVRIHYEIEGREDGPPLLFSHALGANLALRDAQIDEATGLGFRVIRYDCRGHGASSAPARDATIERLGRDVLELLDSLGVERTNFCGVSMGGVTGVWLAMNQPRRLARVALCGTAVWNGKPDLWNERIAKVRKEGTEAIADTILERWFTPEFWAGRPDEMARVRAMIAGTEAAGYVACAAAVRDADLRDMLGLIEAPTLVVIGSRDPSATPEKGQYLVERIPGAQKLVLECAHISNIECAEEFNRAVLGFLADGGA